MSAPPREKHSSTYLLDLHLRSGMRRFAIDELEVLGIPAVISDPCLEHGPDTASCETPNVYGPDTITCSDETVVIISPQPCFFLPDPSPQFVGQVAGTGSFDVITDPGCSWTALSLNSWIRVTAVTDGTGPHRSSGTGPGTVFFEYDANSGASRIGGIALPGSEFVLFQDGSCTYSIDPVFAPDFGSAGGDGFVDLMTQADCPWTVTVEDSWVTITTPTSGTGPTIVEYTVDPYNGSSPRSTVLRVAGRTHFITQFGNCSYSVSPLFQQVPAAGGNFVIDVDAGTGCPWTAVSLDSWITITSGSSGSGTGQVSYTVAVNGGNTRVGHISVAGFLVEITQEPGVCEYTLIPGPLTFPSAGGSSIVLIDTEPGCAWTSVSNDSWIHVFSGASGTGDGSTAFSVDPNPGAARTGTLTIAGQTVTVQQDGLCTYTLSPTSQSFGSAGGTGSFTVTTQSNCPWSPVPSASWITITAGSVGNGSGGVTFSVAANTDPASRTGTITVNDKVFTITQDGTVPPPPPPTTSGLDLHGWRHCATDCWYPAGNLVGLTSSGAFTAAAQNRLFAIPMIFDKARTIGKLAIFLTSDGSASAKARLGIYQAVALGDNYPGTLIVDGGEFGISPAESGTPFKVVTVNQALSADRMYWFVYIHSGATSPQMRRRSSGGPFPQWVGVSSGAFDIFPCMIWVSQTYGALPGTFPGSPTLVQPGASGHIPFIGMTFTS